MLLQIQFQVCIHNNFQCFICIQDILYFFYSTFEYIYDDMNDYNLLNKPIYYHQYHINIYYIFHINHHDHLLQLNYLIILLKLLFLFQISKNLKLFTIFLINDIFLDTSNINVNNLYFHLKTNEFWYLLNVYFELLKNFLCLNHSSISLT